jgi:hypothetical protein
MSTGLTTSDCTSIRTSVGPQGGTGREPTRIELAGPTASMKAAVVVVSPDRPGVNARPCPPPEHSTRMDVIAAQGLARLDTVGGSMGARIVLELARRGVGGGDTVALDPGGFWSSGERCFLSTSQSGS